VSPLHDSPSPVYALGLTTVAVTLTVKAEAEAFLA